MTPPGRDPDTATRSGPVAASGRTLPSSAPDEGRFPAGTVLAGRYRVIGLLGAGGMGEVYRAHDQILNQTVALKFLTPAHISDAALLRFRNEVRIARQVSHPNVCRVYDLGMVEGLHFLSMEYIDGEDLASLLRRIGRLPQDKAIELTRKICAGLTAAHERGVLHRDLKPANIMIDGRGQPRITDFGLAGLAAEIPLSDLRSGTPAYMSPEQKAGREVTVRSDLYALGLVLHEMFTGRSRRDTSSSPTDLVKDLDPAIERLILRCLEEEPMLRPSSALSVAMALPGGDPIAAALAAGETPSPEMIAAAGGTGLVAPAIGALCLAAVALGLAGSAWMSQRTLITGYLPVSRSAEAMAERARTMIADLGYPDTPAEAASRYELDPAFLEYVQATDRSAQRWERLRSARSPAVTFWYGHSRHALPPPRSLVEEPMIPRGLQPAETVSVTLDPGGRIVQFVAVPARRADAAVTDTPFDWHTAFRHAGLEIDRFTSATPDRVPPAFADQRAAWNGVLPDLGDVPVRIEAAAYAGRLTYFDMIAPWTADEATRVSRSGARPSPLGFAILGIVASSAAVLLAWRNLTAGRADRRGAARTAGALGMAWLLFGATVAQIGDVLPFGRGSFLARTLLTAALVWLMYLAIEPSARRFWPEMLVGWNRLLAGRGRDPLVGREMLVGTVGGVAAVLVYHLWFLAHTWIGLAPPIPLVYDGVSTTIVLMGGWQGSAVIPMEIARSGPTALLVAVVLVLLRMLLRRREPATVALVIMLIVTTGVVNTDSRLSELAYNAANFPIGVFLLVRFGLLATATHLVLYSLLTTVALRFGADVPWAATSYLLAGTVVALALYSYHTALGGRSVFSGAASGEDEGS